MLPRLTPHRRRLLATALSAAGLAVALSAGGAAAVPATPNPCPQNPAGAARSHGAPAPGSDPCADLRAAQDRAKQVDDMLTARRADLASARAQLAALERSVAALREEVARDTARHEEVMGRWRQDHDLLARQVRDRYVAGGGGFVAYLVSADSFGNLLDRAVSVGRVVSAERGLVTRTAAERREAEALLADATARRDQTELQMHQMDALRVVIQSDVARLGRAAVDAHEAATLAAATVALALARAHGTIYPAVDGPVFTADSDLTRPSGLTVQRIEKFLHGTALAGLGKAYIDTEARYHVSANYLVADSILESAWGTSQIARDKHNILGFGADDSHPYEDAVWFPSFAACVDTVARYVAEHYLDPKGGYYNGPTLRGMNVHWASDPDWANKVAQIADSIP
ncbi:MAG TPA: glucosaminidase domain-containing protein [Candidatus Dormibacteraeota bacterium]